MSGFDVFFAGIEDPRAANVSHGLSGMSGMSGIFVLMVAAGLCGASNAPEFARFAESRKRLLGKLTDYDCAPGHETFSRVLRAVGPQGVHAGLCGICRGLREGTGPVSGKVRQEAFGQAGGD